MGSQSGAGTIGRIAVVLLLATNVTSATAGPLVVRVYDSVVSSTSTIVAAEAGAAAILKGAGVDVTSWRDCSTGCTDTVQPGEILVRILHAPAAAAGGVLGCALIDVRTGSGTLATIYGDRVRLVAERTGVDEATLLGRAVAHEIGHLLLGTSQHTDAGLMRAYWSDRELQRGSAEDWTFLGPIR